MVQKITSYTGNFPMGLNFQPTTISGLDISHTGGVVAGNGDVVETAAGTLTVPDNIAWSAYIDVTDGLLKAVDTASLPSADLMIIWDGTSSNGTVNSLRDVRSWTSTASTVAPTPDSFETLIGKLAPDHWWQMNDGSTPLADSGTGSARTGAEVSTPAQYNMPAYTSETRTPHFDGTSDGFDLSDTIVPASTTGTIVFLFKSITSSERCIFHLGDNTVGPTSEFSINLDGSGGFIIDIVKDGSNNSSWTGGSGFDDGLWHLGVLRQPGSGVTLRVDDVNVSLSRADNGDAEDSDWISYVTQVTAGGSIGCRRLDSTNHDLFWDQQLSNIAIWDGVVLSNEQILLLQSSLQLGFWSYLGQTLKPEYNYWFGGASTSPAFNMGTKDPVTDLALGAATVFNYQRPGNAGGDDTNARMSIGQGFLESGADTGPELGGTSFGTLIYVFQHKATDEVKLWNEFGPFQSGPSGGAGGHYTTGVSITTGKAIYFADDGFPGSAQNDTRLFDDVNADNGNFDLIVIVKNDDANAPDFYWNGVLQTVFTDENSTGSLETWWNDHIEGDEWAFGADINAGGAYAAGVILEHMCAIEGVVVTAEQVLELNTRFVIERGSRNMEDICLAAGPSHYFPCTEADVPLIDLGYSCREGSAATVRSRHNVDTEDGAGTVTYQITGPNGSDKGVSFSNTNVRLYMSSGAMGSDSAGEGGAVGFFFKTGNTADNKYLWCPGNNGGAYEHRIRILTSGNMEFNLRNTSAFNRWEFVPPSSVEDDNWHFIYWSCDGTDWKIRLDGIEYTDADTEVTETNSGGFTQVNWWGILPTIDQVAWGNAANSGFNQPVDGELAHLMIWRENDGVNSNNPTPAALARIEVAGGVV